MRKTVIILLWVLIGGGLIIGVGGMCVTILSRVSLDFGERGLLEGQPEITFGMDPTPKWTPDGGNIVFGTVTVGYTWSLRTAHACIPFQKDRGDTISIFPLRYLLMGLR